MTSLRDYRDTTNLIVGQGESKLLHPRLDRVPAGEAMTNTPITSKYYSGAEDPQGTRN